MIKRLGNVLLFVGLVVSGLMLWATWASPDTLDVSNPLAWELAFSSVPLLLGVLARYILGGGWRASSIIVILAIGAAFMATTYKPPAAAATSDQQPAAASNLPTCPGNAFDQFDQGRTPCVGSYGVRPPAPAPCVVPGTWQCAPIVAPAQAPWEKDPVVVPALPPGYVLDTPAAAPAVASPEQLGIQALAPVPTDPLKP